MKISIIILLCGMTLTLATTTAQAAGAPTPEQLRAEGLKNWFHGLAFVPANRVHTTYLEIEEAPENFPPVFRMKFNDATGAAEFFDEPSDDDTPFLSVGATPDFDPLFVAKYRKAKIHGNDRDLIWHPARREYVYYTPMFATVNPHHKQKNTPHEPKVPNSSPAKPQLYFTSITPMLQNSITFGVAWDPGFLIPEDKLDLYAKTNLMDESWTWIAQFDVMQSEGSASFTLDENAVFLSQIDFYHSMAFLTDPIITGFNISTNPPAPSDPVLLALLPQGYEPGEVITNLQYAVQPALRGFFRLGSLQDSDNDSLSDAYEIMVSKTDPNNWDTDGDGMPDGWEVKHGLNPLWPYDALLDHDNDGMPNIYEYKYGTNPRAADSHLITRLIVNSNPVAPNEFATIQQAFNASSPYSIIEIKKGEHTTPSNGFGFIFPAHPVLLMSDNWGRDRMTVIKHPYKFPAFHLRDGQDNHTIIRGLTLRMSGKHDTQTGFYLSNQSLLHPDLGGAAPFFDNVAIELGATSPSTGIDSRSRIDAIRP